MWILGDKHFKEQKEQIQRRMPDIFLGQRGSLDSTRVSEGGRTGKRGSEVACMILQFSVRALTFYCDGDDMPKVKGAEK